ncbi:MAG: hypothetical protein AVDCRST_MAG01-01-2244, partial [uncultured Rubrobacteraceae bacterium]
DRRAKRATPNPGVRGYRQPGGRGGAKPARARLPGARAHPRPAQTGGAGPGRAGRRGRARRHGRPLLRGPGARRRPRRLLRAELLGGRLRPRGAAGQDGRRRRVGGRRGALRLQLGRQRPSANRDRPLRQQVGGRGARAGAGPPPHGPQARLLHAELGDDARADPRWHPPPASRPGKAVPAGGRRGHRGLRRDGLRASGRVDRAGGGDRRGRADHARDRRGLRARRGKGGRLLPGPLGTVRGADGRGVRRDVPVVQRRGLRGGRGSPASRAPRADRLRGLPARPRMGGRGAPRGEL